MSETSNQATVSLCIIVKDGGERWRKCLESIVCPAVPRYEHEAAFDEIVVLIDSRTTDNTEAVAREFAEKQKALGGTFEIQRHDWPDDFGIARGRSFEAASGDWRGWIDADDVLIGAQWVKVFLREKIAPDVLVMLAPYNYLVEPDGRVKIRQVRERFVKWSYGWEWLGAAHETLMPLDRFENPKAAGLFVKTESGEAMSDQILFVHQTSEAEIVSHGPRNDAMIDPDKARNPVDRVRMLYQRGFSMIGPDPKEAERCFREVLAGTGSTDAYSYVMALYDLAGVVAQQGRMEEAKGLALRYLERYPGSRKGYLLMSNLYGIEGNPNECIRWLERAFQIAKVAEYNETDPMPFVDLAAKMALSPAVPMETKHRVNEIIWREGDHGHPYASIRDLQSLLHVDRMGKAVTEYLRFVSDHDEHARALAAHLAVPYPIKRNVELAAERRRITEYIRKHATAEFNGTWLGIQPESIKAVTDDDRSCFQVFARSVWAAEKVWEKGWRRVFEIGCCDGLVAAYIATRFPNVEVVGIDPDRFVAEHGAKMWNLPNLRIEYVPLGQPFTDRIRELGEWCDGWICTEVVEHVRSTRELVFPWGKPGILTTPQRQPDNGNPPVPLTPGPAGHLRILSLSEIQDQLEPTTVTRINDSNPHWAIEVPDGGIGQGEWVLFLCCGSPFLWGPESPYTKGLTGSEECVVYLAEALARRGYRVVVMADNLDGDERIVNGVMWTTPNYLAEHDLYDADGKHTTLVAWRAPGISDFVKSLPVRSRILWLHDATSTIGDLPDSAWGDFGKIVFATEYHRRTYAEVFPATATKGKVISHGIPDMPEATKIPGKVIYASSPDRGLERLLRWWPDVKARVPHATLHTFYGFGAIRTFGLVRPALISFADRIEKMLADLEPLGVVNHGLVSHPELHRHYAESVAWAYPTDFEEIACAHGDTMVDMPRDHAKYPDGIPIKELVGLKGFPVWGFNEGTKRFQLATCTRVWETKVATDLVALTLDNGRRLMLTPEHPILDFDGRWHRADEAYAGMRLMALHRRYELWIKDFNGGWVSESRATGQWKCGRPLLPKEHVDHADPTRRDNRPDRLQVLTSSEHLRKTMTGIRRSELVKGSGSEKFRAWMQSPEGRDSMRRRGPAASKKAWETIRSWSPEKQAEFFRRRVDTRRIRAQMDDEYRERVNRYHAGARDEVRENHRVEAVERISGDFPVYDMEVEGLHNFVAEGVVIHNCLSAAKAQAAGCNAVWSPGGCLSEVVKTSPPFVPSVERLDDDSAREAFVEGMAAALIDGLGSVPVRVFPSWDEVAGKWASGILHMAMTK